MGTVLSLVLMHKYVQEDKKSRINKIKQIKKRCCLRRIKNKNNKKNNKSVTFNDIARVKLFSKTEKVDYKLIEDYDMYIN